jgi:hypothetical protein
MFGHSKSPQDALQGLINRMRQFLPVKGHGQIGVVDAPGDAVLVPVGMPQGKILEVTFSKGMKEDTVFPINHLIGIALRRSGIAEGSVSRHVVEKDENKLVFSVPEKQRRAFVDAVGVIERLVEKNQTDLLTQYNRATICADNLMGIEQGTVAVPFLHVPAGASGSPYFSLGISGARSEFTGAINQRISRDARLQELNATFQGHNGGGDSRVAIPVTSATIVDTLRNIGINVKTPSGMADRVAGRRGQGEAAASL